MLARDVLDRLSASAPPFTGVYQKRPGSGKDRSLFCWFNIEDRNDENDVFPHVSIHVDGNNELDELHVTSSVLTDRGKRRFANYYSVKGTTVKFVKESADMSFGTKDGVVANEKGDGLDVYRCDCDGALRAAARQA